MLIVSGKEVAKEAAPRHPLLFVLIHCDKLCGDIDYIGFPLVTLGALWGTCTMMELSLRPSQSQNHPQWL